MKCSTSTIDRLGRVRDVRMRLAEMALARADHELCACREAEEQARRDLDAATERSAAETAQANEALLSRHAGGRSGITSWQAARRHAQQSLRTASGQVDDAVSSRVDKELECSTARGHWRDARYETERLRLLAERLLVPLE